MKFAVFVSGQGSNLQAIINAVQKGKIKAQLALVICDNPKAYALKRARQANITTVFINPQVFVDRKKYDGEMIKYLQREKIDFIVLAGFMRILSEEFVRKYKGKVLNIHPSLLPAFRGAHAIADAFEYGVKVTGVTVHFVDVQVDHGPVIVQEMVPVKSNDTLSALEKRIHQAEHKLYPKAIDLFARRRLKIRGRKVVMAG